MTAEVREQLIVYLTEAAVFSNPGVVPHPIEITIARVP